MDNIPVVPMQLPRAGSFTFKVEDGKDKVRLQGAVVQPGQQFSQQAQQQQAIQTQQQQYFDINNTLRSLPRVSSLGQVQFNNQLGSSPYNSFYAPQFHQNGGVDGVHANITMGHQSSSSTAQSQYATHGGTNQSPIPHQTLNKYPSMPHLDSFHHLKFLVDDEVRKRKTSLGNASRTLAPSDSYLCMKSIIEDDLSRNGITLPTKNSSQAIQSLLEHQQDEAKWGNAYRYPHGGNQQMQVPVNGTYGSQYMVPGMPTQVAIDPRQVVNGSTPTANAKRGKATGRRGAKASASDDKVRKTSAYRGVSFHTSSGNWRARIKVQGNSKHLGYYKNEHDAAKAYDDASLEIYGENAPNNRSLREEFGQLDTSNNSTSQPKATNSTRKLSPAAKITKATANSAPKASTSTSVVAANVQNTPTSATGPKSVVPLKQGNPVQPAVERNINSEHTTSSNSTTSNNGVQSASKSSAASAEDSKDDGDSEQVMSWDENQPIEDLIKLKSPPPTNGATDETNKRKATEDTVAREIAAPAAKRTVLLSAIASDKPNTTEGDSDSDIGAEEEVVKIPLNSNWQL